MSEIELSVVIPTYNRVDRLRYVVPTLLEQSLDPARYELVVADSRSDDGTAEFITTLNERQPGRIRFIPGAYTGRAAARNAGIEAARGKVVLFTDADILATPTLLERHIRQHREAPGKRIAVVGCELQVQSLADYERQRDDESARRPLHPATRKQLSWLYFLTGNASVGRDELLAVGGFDEQFTGYGHEDLELGYRLVMNGIAIVYDAAAINFHWHPVPFAEQVGRMELAGVSTVRFYRKHPDFRVKANLGMTSVSLAFHTVLQAAAPLRRALEKAGAHDAPRKNTWPYIARQIAYQYHYVSGIKRALKDPGSVR
ncbi:MAG: glycosyltransferase [Candidatus Eremiobacteraeota bacterium]|nr:glycosyltransferase [Candidatus Eremiobacteraeota bacterium]